MNTRRWSSPLGRRYRIAPWLKEDASLLTHCMLNRASLSMTKRTWVIHSSSNRYKRARGSARGYAATLILLILQLLEMKNATKPDFICFLTLVRKSFRRSGLQKTSTLGSHCWPVLFLWGSAFCWTFPHDVHRRFHQVLRYLNDKKGQPISCVNHIQNATIIMAISHTF